MLPAAGVSSAPPNFLAVLAVVVLSVLNRSRCAGCKPSWNWHRRCLGAWHKNQAKCESEDSACNGPRHIHSLPFDYSFARYQYHMRFHGIAYLRARQAIKGRYPLQVFVRDNNASSPKSFRASATSFRAGVQTMIFFEHKNSFRRWVNFRRSPCGHPRKSATVC
jgi:hypothetical protein